MSPSVPFRIRSSGMEAASVGDSEAGGAASSSTRGALTASVVSLGLKVGGLGCALIFQLLLLHYCGATAFGNFSFYIAWALTLAAVARFGADTLAMRLTPLYFSENNNELLGGFLRFVLAGVAATGIAAGIVFVLGSQLLRHSATELPLPLAALVSAAATIGLLSLTLVMEAVLRSRGRIIQGSSSAIVSSIASIVLLIGVSQWGYPIDTATAIHIFAAGYLAAFVPVAVSVLRIWPPGPPRFERRSWVRVAFPLAFSGIIGIFQGQCGTICCGLLATAEDAGRFALAMRFAGMLLVGQQAINAVLAPRFSTCHARDDRPGLQHLATLSAWGALVVAGLGCVGFLLMTQFAGQYTPSLDAAAIRLTIVLMAGTLAAALAGSAGYILLMTGHQKQAMAVLGVSLVFMLGLNLALTPVYGAMGSAVAQVITTLATNLVLFLLTRRYLRINSVIGRMPIPRRPAVAA